MALNPRTGRYEWTDPNGNVPFSGDVIEYVTFLQSSGQAEEAARTISQLPTDQQQSVWRTLDGTWATDTVDHLQTLATQERQKSFREYAKTGDASKLLPGVDRAGGGTNLPPDAVQSLLTSRGESEAEALQGEQPGLDAYQEDAVLDQGPATSFLDKLKGEGAFYDESVEGMDLTDYEAAQQERTDTTGREAQERSLADYDAVIGQEGLTAVDRARIEEMRQDTARRARAQEGAILADAAEQGRGGGNASLLLRNQAQQSATNTRALGDMQTAAMGLERKDSAIRNRGFLGGDIQASDDAIDKFNTQNSQATLDNNAAAKNRAEAERWGQEQDNQNENVDVTQGAIGVDHDAEISRSDKNADRQYGANVANDQGEQAHYGDKWGSLLNKYGITQSGPAYDAGPKGTPGSPGDSGIAAAGSGAIGGASAGAALGPWGAAGGAVIGGAAGFLGGRKKRERGSSGAW
jgi:hypothetical protein